MKTKYILAIGALAATLGFVPLCTAESYVPPQGPAQPQIKPMPTGVVWDGSEYVGQMSGKYYYLGPNNTWLPMDNARQQRFDEWQKTQPTGNAGETTRSQGQYSNGNNPNAQPNQTENTGSQGGVKGQNAMEQSGQTGNTGYQGQQMAQNPGGNNPNGQSSQIRNTRHQGHDLGQTRTVPPVP